MVVLSRMLWVLLLALLLCSPCFADEKGPVVRVATLFGYAPYCFTKPVNKSIQRENLPPGKQSLHFRGYSWDIIREAFHGAGYEIELSVLPWKRAYAFTLNGDYDILFPATRTPSREKLFAFGQIPVNDSRALLYVRRDSPLKWQGLLNLPYLDVAVQRGFSYGDEWDALTVEQIRKYDVDSIKLGFSMLLSGRVDAYAGYEANWDYVAREMDVLDKLRKLPVFHNGLEYAIARIEDGAAVKILQVLNRRMREMQDSGRIAELRRKWDLPPLE